jgi:hypothetical protein
VAIAISGYALLGMSSPGKAWDLAKSPVPAVATILPTNNIPGTVPVPSAPISPALDPAPDEVTTASAAGVLPFASLAAAVAAQDLAGDGDSELSCLATAVYFESKSEPLSGQLAVADVIINRTTSGRFPSTICGVVKQPGQFSFVHGGRIPAVASNAQYRTAMAIAKIAMADGWEDPAPDALYFHARYVSPGWSGKARVATIGNHVFFR